MKIKIYPEGKTGKKPKEKNKWINYNKQKELQSFNDFSNENVIYTDGSCDKHKIGGWSFTYKDYSEYGSLRSTTNNQMELLAVIKALEYSYSLNHDIIIVSDSQYCIKGSSIWMYSWFKNGKLNKLDLKNVDLWKQVYKLVKESKNKIQFAWIKGHAGNEMNEKVDKLANKGRIELSNDSRLKQNAFSEVINEV